MLEKREALERAARFLVERSQTWPSSNVRPVQEHSFLEGDRLIAPYDRIEFLDHGDQDSQLGGNLPIAVDLKTGECSFISWDDANSLMDRGLL